MNWRSGEGFKNELGSKLIRRQVACSISWAVGGNDGVSLDFCFNLCQHSDHPAGRFVPPCGPYHATST